MNLKPVFNDLFDLKWIVSDLESHPYQEKKVWVHRYILLHYK